MRSYNLTVLVNAGLEGEAKDKFVGKMEKVAQALGGKVKKVTEMGKKQLAYKIAGAGEAQFLKIGLELPAGAVVQLEKKLNIERGILRHLLVLSEEGNGSKVSK